MEEGRGQKRSLQRCFLEEWSESSLGNGRVIFRIRRLTLEMKGAGGRGTLAKIDVMKIIALFDDDPVAQKIVIAMMDGTGGEELEQLSGLNSTEYETKRKKIRRRIEKLEAGSDGKKVARFIT